MRVLGNGALSHSRLTHQDGVVFLPSAEHLADAFDFLRTSDDGVEAALFSHARQVASKIVEHRGFGLGVALPGSRSA